MKKPIIAALAAAMLLSGCTNSHTEQDAGKAETQMTTELTESTTEQLPAYPLTPNAETITAYGQLLNNACVYLNENHADKITGDIRQEYDAACEELHNINLQGISAFAKKSEEERSEIFSQLEEIERIIFDSVAQEIGVKAELTEAVTTSADKHADEKRRETITSAPEETTEAPERITAST